MATYWDPTYGGGKPSMSYGPNTSSATPLDGFSFMTQRTPPAYANAGALDETFGSMLPRVAQGPQNAFNPAQLAALNAQGLQQLRANQSALNAGAGQSAAARGIAGPNFGTLFGGANNAANRGALAQGDLNARLKGLEMGNQQYQSFANAANQMGALGAQEADRQAQIWQQQLSTDLAQQLQDMMGSQAMQQIGGRGEQERLTSAQEFGQESQLSEQRTGEDIQRLTEQYKNNLGLAQYENLSNRDIMILDSWLKLGMDPATIMKIMESGGGEIRNQFDQRLEALAMMGQGTQLGMQEQFPIVGFNPETGGVGVQPGPFSSIPSMFPERATIANAADVPGNKSKNKTLEQYYDPSGNFPVSQKTGRPELEKHFQNYVQAGPETWDLPDWQNLVRATQDPRFEEAMNNLPRNTSMNEVLDLAISLGYDFGGFRWPPNQATA